MSSGAWSVKRIEGFALQNDCMNKRTIIKPVAIGSLTKEQLDAELQKGMDDIAAGRVIPAEQVEAEMRKLYGV